MAQFHHHPDGVIYVRTERGVYADTVTNFSLDFGQGWPLPQGVAELLYDDTPKAGRHALFDAKSNNVGSGVVPFPFGDVAIAAVVNLLAKRAARFEALKPKTMPMAVRNGTPPSTGTNKV